jgi:hypothetical protein
MPDPVNDPERYELICRKGRIDHRWNSELAGRQRSLLPSPAIFSSQDSLDLGAGGWIRY